LIGNYQSGILHGDVISAALDVIGAGAVLCVFLQEGPLPGIGTVDLRIDYLRPADGAYFLCTGQVMRPGRILASTAWNWPTTPASSAPSAPPSTGLAGRTSSGK